jgi:hypothetical protein
MPNVTLNGLAAPTIAALDQLAGTHIPEPDAPFLDTARTYPVTPRQLTTAIAEGMAARPDLKQPLYAVLRWLQAWHSAQLLGTSGDTGHVTVDHGAAS